MPIEKFWTSRVRSPSSLDGICSRVRSSGSVRILSPLQSPTPSLFSKEPFGASHDLPLWAEQFGRARSRSTSLLCRLLAFRLVLDFYLKHELHTPRL